VVVLGPGGVGGFIAVALARRTPIAPAPGVSVVATEQTARLINRDGLALTSTVLGESVARPRAVSHLDEPADLLFVATKATDLAPALARVRITPRLVVPLLNGLEHVEELRSRFGPGHVAAASIRIESERVAPGVIVQSSPEVRVELGADDPLLAAMLPDVAELLSGAGIPTSIGRSEQQVLWSKLVRLVALSAVTAAYDQPLGTIRSDRVLRQQLTACVREAAAVAAAAGAGIDPEDTLAELQAAHPTLRSSMQRDIAAGREPELDAIQGAVLRAAARLKVPCPTVQALSELIAQRAGMPWPGPQGPPSQHGS